MIRYIFIFTSLLLATFSSVQAQGPTNNDTLVVEHIKNKDAWKLDHKPMKATWLSVALPGAGQIYNHKYWKAPIVWAGMGISLYFVIDNTTNFNHFKDAYLASLEGNNPYDGQYTSANLLSITDQYRRWRDQSYIAMGLFYFLNIMDAAVDGYLVTFDVSEDLSLGLRPYTDFAVYPINGLTLTLNL